jgi:glycerol-3-phosphate cytidylyltransferase-like family protein
MSLNVIMPGGFHPFHAGHRALYEAAKKAFPGANIYIAATNDMKERPFPFAVKEKLARLSGVQPGQFVQVKSPFQPREITENLDTNSDVVVFVRSEKDKDESPKAGGTKKDGTPSYFQPWDPNNLQPISKHAYMAYLPTVEFGPGITSATEIRDAWPRLNPKRKQTLVMSLYPAVQKNPQLTENVVKMFDQIMGGQQVAESKEDKEDEFGADLEVQQLLRKAQQHYPHSHDKQQAFVKFVQRALKHSEEEDTMQDKEIADLQQDVGQIKQAVNQIKVTENADYLEEK